MANEDDDQSKFLTPSLTPYASAREHIQYPTNLDQLVRGLEETFSSLHPDDESEIGSDAQDQQATEATDESDLSTQVQKDPVAISFEAQPSHDRDDICSPSQDIEPAVESFIGVTSELDVVYEVKPTLVCTESLCVPYTTITDEISIIKEAITTTTTFTTECKKDKNDLGHIMISYNHSTRVLCSKIAKALKNLNYLVWIDQDNISGDILTSMASAVENSFVVLMAINDQYSQSRYCRLEAEYAVERNKASIPMLMQAGYKAAGWLGIINGSKLYVDFSTVAFDEAFNLLIREIEAIRMSLGADGIMEQSTVSTVMNQSVTTMSSSWNYYQNVQDWTSDDVMDWLHREKLYAFENVLMGFTGATLWQLYKIRFDSAPDYYRMVESLLPPEIPLRLLYNLTFNAALEALFSSPNQKMFR